MVLITDQIHDQLLGEADEVTAVFENLLLDLFAVSSVPVLFIEVLVLHWYRGGEVEAADVDLLETGLHENQILVEVKVEPRRHRVGLVKLADLELVQSIKSQRVDYLPVLNAPVVGECVEHLEEK